MLIPDNIHPEQTLYYNGSFVLKILLQLHETDMLDLYVRTKATRDMTMPVFVLCLDWLFLLNLIRLDEHGRIRLCI